MQRRAGRLHRAYGGRIAYLHDHDGETGRERFTVTVQPDGVRTVRASCEMDGEALLRDVTYTVDARWRPLDAYVRLVQNGAHRGSAWFRFDARGAECEALTATEGRVRQRVDLPRWPTMFAPHPLVTDGWQAAAYDYHAGPGTQRLECCTNSSPRPDGASGPLVGVVHKDLEYVGDERVQVRAGTFDARHLRIQPRAPGMADWPPLEFWVAGDDFLLLRMRWDLLRSTYELVELEGTAR
jgi:hypothetical protein